MNEVSHPSQPKLSAFEIELRVRPLYSVSKAQERGAAAQGWMQGGAYAVRRGKSNILAIATQPNPTQPSLTR